jgi:phytanoyl-CoA hydroxylase
MNYSLTKQQINFYQTNGYLLIENFLNEAELSFWREAVTEAIQQRGGKKMPGSDAKVGEDDGINKTAITMAKYLTRC